MCEQVFNKEGICISESLGLCKGCEAGFLEDLRKNFKGIFIHSTGKTEQI